MCVGGPPKPPPLPTPRPTAPAPERTAKTVVTGAQRKKKSSATGGATRMQPRRSGTRSLRIPLADTGYRCCNLNY